MLLVLEGKQAPRRHRWSPLKKIKRGAVLCSRAAGVSPRWAAFDGSVHLRLKNKNHVLCSCFPVSMSALQSVLPIGVWRAQRCYYLTTTARCCCRHFHSSFLRTETTVWPGENAKECIQSPLSHTLPLSITSSVQSLCCYQWRYFVNFVENQ